MAVLSGLRAVSGDAASRLAVRFSDLPRPVLAAIGAGDLLLEQMREVREAAAAMVGDPATHVASTGGRRQGGPASAGTGEDPAARTRRAAADLGTEIPDHVARLSAEIPKRVAYLSARAAQVTPEALRDVVESAGNLAGEVYTVLAVRGRQSWSRVRAGGGPGSVVDAAAP